MITLFEPSLIHSLGYVGFGADDPAAWAEFFESAIGIGVGDRLDDGSVLMAMDDHDLRIAAHPGENGKLLYVGWLVRQRAALDVLASQLTKAGTEVAWFDDEDRAARRVRHGFRLVDPVATPLEVVYAPTAGGPGREPAGPRFSVAHVVLGVEQPDLVEPFYTDLLGFRVSDYIRVPWGTQTIDVTFLRVGDGRHHSFALQAGLGLGLEHFNLQVPTVDDVGRLWERCRKGGLPIVEDLGRHSVSDEVSFYLMTPNGVMVECGTGITVVDDATWTPRQLTNAELWGHQVMLDPGADAAVAGETGRVSEWTGAQAAARH
jgi:2,3-dihydroxybiphenyl 1,2-dioxygenase